MICMKFSVTIEAHIWFKPAPVRAPKLFTNMETIDHVILAVVLVFCFGAYSILQSIWNMSKVVVLKQTKKIEAGTQTVLAGTQTVLIANHDLKDEKVWFTKQGGKWHLNENCYHIDGKDKMYRDGLCATCSESHLLRQKFRWVNPVGPGEKKTQCLNHGESKASSQIKGNNAIFNIK